MTAPSTLTFAAGFTSVLMLSSLLVLLLLLSLLHAADVFDVAVAAGVAAASTAIQVSGLRGGAVVGSGEGTEEDADSFEALDDDDFDDGMNEEDFGEANFVDELKQDWRKTPINTRTFFQVTDACYDRGTVYLVVLIALLVQIISDWRGS